MKKENSLLERLKEYSKSDVYPFHMPGHKRQETEGFAVDFPNPFSIDITEIKGFDHLHNPEGMLKESMEWAASVYGSDHTYYLVNGSSCGIMSAICGTTNNSGTILLSRNSHKSAYYGVFLNHLRTNYIYPQLLKDTCVQGGLLPDEIEDMLKTHGDIQAVFVVSPTYDGIVSDIKSIAKITHKYKIPLIVDEAHGAHFHFGEKFPVSALELGADIVIQSLHKTLPSFTQTALLHINEGYVDVERVEQYLQIFQSSSPSYLFMAGIENCIWWMEEDQGKRMNLFTECILAMRKRLAKMQCLKLLDKDVIGSYGVFDLDCSKLVVSTKGMAISGAELDQILRERYHLEMEMCGADTVTAILTLADTETGLGRLEMALLELDGELAKGTLGEKTSERTMEIKMEQKLELQKSGFIKPEIPMTIFDGVNAKKVSMPIEACSGRISTEYIYVYPPGIPIVAPGEVLQPEMITMILNDQKLGLAVQGPKDQTLKTIWVVE